MLKHSQTLTTTRHRRRICMLSLRLLPFSKFCWTTYYLFPLFSFCFSLVMFSELEGQGWRKYCSRSNLLALAISVCIFRCQPFWWYKAGCHTQPTSRSPCKALFLQIRQQTTQKSWAWLRPKLHCATAWQLPPFLLSDLTESWAKRGLEINFDVFSS